MSHTSLGLILHFGCLFVLDWRKGNLPSFMLFMRLFNAHKVKQRTTNTFPTASARINFKLPTLPSVVRVVVLYCSCWWCPPSCRPYPGFTGNRVDFSLYFVPIYLNLCSIRKLGFISNAGRRLKLLWVILVSCWWVLLTPSSSKRAVSMVLVRFDDSQWPHDWWH